MYLECQTCTYTYFNSTDRPCPSCGGGNGSTDAEQAYIRRIRTTILLVPVVRYTMSPTITPRPLGKRKGGGRPSATLRKPVEDLLS